MSSARNHGKRAHRSEALRRGAYGNMARRAAAAASDAPYGKGLAARLQLFHRRILKSREKAAESE